jgi:streptomycin 6-kinase
VLKIPFIYDQNRHEADALRHYQGRGAVKLQDFDPATGALLLERIEPGTPLGEHADRSAITAIGCELLQRVWSEAVTPHPFRPLRDLVEEWAVCIPTDFERRGRRFPETFVTEAMSLLRELAAGDGREVLINHDLHLGNRGC